MLAHQQQMHVDGECCVGGRGVVVAVSASFFSALSFSIPFFSAFFLKLSAFSCAALQAGEAKETFEQPFPPRNRQARGESRTTGESPTAKDERT